MVMPGIVFQGLQSCLDSQLAEQRTLRLRIAPTKPLLSQLLELDIDQSSDSEHVVEECHKEGSNKTTPFSPNCVLSNCFSSPSCPNPSGGTMNITHPYITETLGSETGSDMVVGDCIFTHPSSSSSSSPNVGNSPTRRERSREKKRSCSGRNFPPPLTTISGSESLWIRPHREGGRVVMNAVAAPTPPSFLKVERSHGRLRLHFLKNDSSREFDDSEEAATEEIENDNSEREKSFENEGKGDEDEVEGEVGCDACLGVTEGMGEYNLGFGVEMGMEKLRRPHSCKGRCMRNEELLYWESLSVATS